MAKIAHTIRTKLPTYQKDRQKWRRQILANVREAAEVAGVQYDNKVQLQIDVILYMKKGKQHDIHDVDNRLKDILDALQGRFRGYSPKTEPRLIDNDNKICKATIEKRPTPKALKQQKTNTGGRIVIQSYRRVR